MYMQCKICGNKHFLVNVVNQVNGNDDTYEFICAGCGEYYGLPDPTEISDNDTYLECELDKVQRGNGSICLEKWIIDGDIVYFVTVYCDDEILKDREFNVFEMAEKCYKKCTDIFESIGDIDKIIELFDDC
jgi:hypothetical protein